MAHKIKLSEANENLSLKEIWDKAIKPLYEDYFDRRLVCGCGSSKPGNLESLPYLFFPHLRDLNYSPHKLSFFAQMKYGGGANDNLNELFANVSAKINEAQPEYLVKVYDDIIEKTIEDLDRVNSSRRNGGKSAVKPEKTAKKAKNILAYSMRKGFQDVFSFYNISVNTENATQSLTVLVMHALLQARSTGSKGEKNFEIEQAKLQRIFDIYVEYIAGKPTEKPHSELYFASDGSYFDQTLYDSQRNPIFKVSAPNFDEIKNKHILIIGDGGQGKTLFLKQIRAIAGSKDVRYCRLAGLGKQALDKHDGESVILKALNAQKEITNNCTLLLDGFNETYKDGAEAAAAIAKEIAEIADKQNTTIIVTSRAGNAAAFPDEFRRFEVHTISGVSAEARDEYCSSHSDFPEKLKPLLGIPMYFNYIKDAEEAPKSQYELLEGIYRRQFMQSDRSACAYVAFYMLAPWVVHKEGSHTVIDGQSLDRAARQLSENPALSEALFYASLELLRNRSVSYSFNDVDIKESYRLLRANGPFSIDTEDNSFVIHESIADYLKSFSELLVLRAIQNCWESDVLGREEALQALSGLSVECGSLSDLSRKLLVEELGLDGSVQEANDSMRLMYKSLLARSRLFVDEFTVLLTHTTFIISDLLSLGRKLEAATSEILGKMIDAVKRSFFLQNSKPYFAEAVRARCEKAVLEMISKMIEYDRVASRHESAFELISLAEQISSDDRALASITNQKGKLLLAMHRDFSCDGTSVLEPFTGKEDDLLLDGLALLEKNCEIGYNISCALVGMIYSEIAPYLIRSGIKIDVIKAFCTYLQVVKKRAKWRDRKIGYTTRKAIMLLLCGRVSVKTRFFDLRDLESYQESDFAVGDNNPMNLSENALALVRILVDLLYGETSGLAYAKGVLALRDGDLQRAKAYFESEPEWIQNQIMLNHFCDANFDLAGAYEKLEKNKKNPLYEQNGFVDQAHSVYTLLACTNLQIALNGKASVDIDRVKGEFPEEVQDVIECLRIRAPE